MDLVVALGISIGVLIAAWVYVAVGMPDLGLIVWAGIVAWATFYAAGGGADGLKKAIGSNLAGNFWAAVALYVTGVLGGDVLTLSIAFGVVAFIFCLQSKIPLLAFIPGAFLGAATWVGVDVAGASGDGGVVDVADVMIPVSMVVGAVLGFISEAVGKKLAG
ncbi:Inner membrane protein YcdZ [Methylophilaceae bacterium]|nr:Inner membrane protein YcdZ [Methylophilaceae bacterium]